MERKQFTIKLMDIIPQQHFLSIQKYKTVELFMKNNDDYGDLFVIEYRDRIFLIDGHHRLFYLYSLGIELVDVICELADNEERLYQILADESLEMGLNYIGDLGNRFIDDYDIYKREWIDKCKRIENEINNEIR